jgi:hypothetical protein
LKKYYFFFAAAFFATGFFASGFFAAAFFAAAIVVSTSYRKGLYFLLIWQLINILVRIPFLGTECTQTITFCHGNRPHLNNN